MTARKRPRRRASKPLDIGLSGTFSGTSEFVTVASLHAQSSGLRKAAGFGGFRLVEITDYQVQDFRKSTLVNSSTSEVRTGHLST
jgi:hypothetical protein